MPGMCSRQNRGMISSPKDLEVGTRLLPGRTYAAMRYSLQRAQYTTGLQQFLSGGYHEWEPKPSPQLLHTECNAPRNSIRSAPQKCPSPLNRLLGRKQQCMCIHPGNQNAAGPSLKSHIVPSIAISNHFSVLKFAAQKIYILAIKIIFKL